MFDGNNLDLILVFGAKSTVPKDTWQTIEQDVGEDEAQE